LLDLLYVLCIFIKYTDYPQIKLAHMNTEKNLDLGKPLAYITLRIWLGMRCLQTGIEKFGGNKTSDTAENIDGAPNSYGLTESSSEKVYSTANYHGVPEALKSKFASEPLIPDFFLSIYDIALGPLLIILGLTTLIGFATRISLFAMGLVYTSLTFGLILIKQDAGIAWLGVHIIMIAMGLTLAKYNKFAFSPKVLKEL